MAYSVLNLSYDECTDRTLSVGR